MAMILEPAKIHKSLNQLTDEERANMKLFAFLDLVFADASVIGKSNHNSKISDLKMKLSFEFDKDAKLDILMNQYKETKQYLSTNLSITMLNYCNSTVFELLEKLKPFEGIDSKLMLGYMKDAFKSMRPTDIELQSIQNLQESEIFERGIPENYFVKVEADAKIDVNKILTDYLKDYVGYNLLTFIFKLHYQRQFLNFLMSEISILKGLNPIALVAEQPSKESNLDENEGNSLTIKKPKLKTRQKDDDVTNLSQKQTVLLIEYLRQSKVFFSPDSEYQTDVNIAKGVQILTGYSNNTIRTDMSNLRDLRNDKKDLRELLKIIEKIKSLINNDLV